jgi:hypothetical protein
MATRQIGITLWVAGLTLVWSAYPLLFSHAQGIIVLSAITALLALLSLITGWQPVVIWSGGLGLCNLTLALLVTASPPNLWTGLSAGIVLLALVDGSHRLAYLRQCWLAPGVLTVLLNTFVRLSGLTLGIGLLVGLLLIPLGYFSVATGAGAITIIGACLLVGTLAVFLWSTSRSL